MMHYDIPTLVIDRDAIVTGLRVSDKNQLFSIIGEQFAHVYGLDNKACTHSMQQREQLGSTGFGRGIAIPHARMTGISRPLGLFVQLAEPLDYGAVDATPVDLVWAMLSPLDRGADHLRALAHISRMLRDDALVTRLRGATEHDAIYALLGEQLQRYAA